MNQIESFAVVAAPDAAVLILGSMPGVESLRQQQYYAHPKNMFWDVMGDMFGAGRGLSYSERLEVLKKNRLALWDVAHRCARRGSLDANIEAATVVPNAFTALYRYCPHIRFVFFNGHKAAELYRRLVLPQLTRDMQQLERITLPSTSPANASIPPAIKRQRWQSVRQALETGQEKIEPQRRKDEIS